MSSFAVLPLAGFLALISAAVSPATAQSSSPPVLAKPHPGVPLVKPDAQSDAPAAQLAPKNADGKSAKEDNHPPGNAAGAKGSAKSKPGSAVGETHGAAHSAQSKSHISASSRGSASKAHASAAGAQTHAGSATGRATGRVVVAPGAAAPPAQVLIAQSSSPSTGGKVSTGRRGGELDESGSFNVSQLGHAVGTAEFRIARSWRRGDLYRPAKNTRVHRACRD